MIIISSERIKNYIDDTHLFLNIVNYDKNDTFIGVKLCSIDEDILLSSSNGKCLRFPVTKLRLFSGLNSSGVRGIKLDKDNNTKVIILNGAGKGFSAGHNLKEVKSLKVRSKYLKLFNLCSKVMIQIVEGRKPVIAKVHGAAYAAGCQLATSCDLAYSTKDATFATPGVNIGLFCSTPMVAVSRKISRKRMMKMLLTLSLIHI